MKTQFDPTDPEHLRERADAQEALRDGRPLQYLTLAGEWMPRDTCEGLPFQTHLRYRPAPITFPDLPPGEEWHNPAGLTPEQVGWKHKLLTKRERKVREAMGYDKRDCECWEPIKGSWDAGFTGANAGLTYRIPRETPFLLPEPPPEPWRLPEPPAGRQWHRLDWMQNMLPQGYRPYEKRRSY